MCYWEYSIPNFFHHFFDHLQSCTHKILPSFPRTWEISLRPKIRPLSVIIFNSFLFVQQMCYWQYSIPNYFHHFFDHLQCCTHKILPSFPRSWEIFSDPKFVLSAWLFLILSYLCSKCVTDNILFPISSTISSTICNAVPIKFFHLFRGLGKFFESQILSSQRDYIYFFLICAANVLLRIFYSQFL